MILVTGGLGMIGAHTALALAELGQDVVVTSYRQTDVPSFFAGTSVVVEQLDVTDREAFLALGKQYDITGIVHLAGTIPGADPVAYFRTDTAGLLNALDAARTWGVRRFAVASSLGVYIGQDESPWHEELAVPTADLPHHIIAFKKAAEPITTHALKGSDVHPVILRIGSTWGPLMDPESIFSPIPPYVSALLRGQTPTPLKLPVDGGGDWCYAPDMGRAIALLMTAPTLNHTTYNVSSGRPYTNPQLAAALNQDTVPGGEMAPHMSITRLTTDTGFTPEYTFPEAIAHYLSWRKVNPR
jgi:nucleoside-diphosphate-sugar epimerase